MINRPLWCTKFPPFTVKGSLTPKVKTPGHLGLSNTQFYAKGAKAGASFYSYCHLPRPKGSPIVLIIYFILQALDVDGIDIKKLNSPKPKDDETPAEPEMPKLKISLKNIFDEQNK